MEPAGRGCRRTAPGGPGLVPGAHVCVGVGAGACCPGAGGTAGTAPAVARGGGRPAGPGRGEGGHPRETPGDPPMKIVDIVLTPVSYPAPHPLRWGFGIQDRMGGTVIQVVTDEGLVGIGDANGPIAAQRAHVRDVLLPLLRGQDPLDVERLWALTAGQERGRDVA